jgi:hypothetical protein
MTVLRDRVLLQRLKQLFAAGSRLGYIKPEFAAVGGDIEIEILGERKRATPYTTSRCSSVMYMRIAAAESTMNGWSRPRPRNSARRST